MNTILISILCGASGFGVMHGIRRLIIFLKEAKENKGLLLHYSLDAREYRVKARLLEEENIELKKNTSLLEEKIKYLESSVKSESKPEVKPIIKNETTTEKAKRLTMELKDFCQNNDCDMVVFVGSSGTAIGSTYGMSDDLIELIASVMISNGDIKRIIDNSVDEINDLSIGTEGFERMKSPRNISRPITPEDLDRDLSDDEIKGMIDGLLNGAGIDLGDDPDED